MNKLFKKMRENYVNERQKKSNICTIKTDNQEKNLYIGGEVRERVELTYIF